MNSITIEGINNRIEIVKKNLVHAQDVYKNFNNSQNKSFVSDCKMELQELKLLKSELYN